MATIFITVSRGSIAWNIFGSGKLHTRLRNAGHRLVLLVPTLADPFFTETFGGDGIRMAQLVDPRQTFLDQVLVGLHKALVYNTTTDLRDRYGFLSASETNAVRRVLKRLIFRPLRNIGWLKEAVRWADALFRPAREYDALFAEEQPALVFVTNPTETADAHVMKAARRHGVRVVAMPKSWDNLPKLSMRAKPDHLLVWGSAIVRHAQAFQNMRSADITVVGVPQFDVVADAAMEETRETFFAKIGVDPARKLIVFGSEGKVTPGDPAVAAQLALAVHAGAFGMPATLYIRPYFALKGEEDKFAALRGMPNVVIDRWFTRRSGFRDSWDYSQGHAAHFSNLIRHADVMVCYTSTLTLDAALYDRPVVHIGFDGDVKKPYGESHRRWYDSEHFKEIMAASGIRIAETPDELIAQVRDALADPRREAAGRTRLIASFCMAADGKAGERIAEAVLLQLP